VRQLMGSDFSQLQQILSAREQLQQIHSANIANADTPNYKADIRRFDQVLKSKASLGTHLQKSNPHHLSSSTSSSVSLLAKHDVFDGARMDGNSVNLQREMAEMAKNQLLYEYSLQLMKNKISGMQSILRAGDR